MISIDLYNKNIYVRLPDIQHHFANVEIFELGTGFSHEFPDARIVSLEPDRNLFLVERLNGFVVSGRDVPEIDWLYNNFSEISAAALEDIERGAHSVTVKEVRVGKLFATDWLIVRHNEQQMMGVSTTLNSSQLQELHDYRQMLRNIPDSDLSKDGTKYVWPTIPACVPSL